MANQYVTIDQIVRSTLGDRGETNHLYSSYMRFAIKGYREFNYDHALEIKTESLAMTAYNAVNLPCDFVDWVKIGVPVGDRILRLSPGSDINLINTTDDDGDETTNISANEVDFGYDDYYEHQGEWYGLYFNARGENLGRNFGNGGSTGGQFVIKKDREQIQFTSDINCDNIYLEYITDGINPSGGTLVHKYAQSTIEAFIHWQVAKFKFGAASNEAQALKQEHYNQLRIYKARVNPLTPSILIDIANGSYRRSNKN